MKIYTYEQLKETNFGREEYETFKMAGNLVKEKFGCSIPTDYSSLLSRILRVSPSLQGKTILDLGCGSLSKPDDKYSVKGHDNFLMSDEWDNLRFRPYLPRMLHVLGAEVIGVDIGSLEGEPYEHYQKDLTQPKSLDEIADNSIDIAHSFLLYTSPTLQKTSGYSDFCDAFDSMMKTLKPQIERVVKPEGVVVFDYWPGISEKKGFKWRNS